MNIILIMRYESQKLNWIQEEKLLRTHCRKTIKITVDI